MPQAMNPKSTRRWLLFPFPVWVLLAAIVFAALLQTVLMDRALGVFIVDQGVANIFSAAAILLAGLLILAWFTLFSGYARRTRWLVFAAVLGAVVLFNVAFRFEGFTGNMVPSWSLRFIPKHDQAMRPPAAPPDQDWPPIDLTTTTPEDFPQFLGPQRQCAAADVSLARDWNTHPPRWVWKNEKFGAGWSGFAVVNGYAVTQEQFDQYEFVTCYDVKTGELKWFHRTPTRYETMIAGVGPRATPTIDHGRVYALGATGKLLCLDGSNGKMKWEKDLPHECGLTPQEERARLLYGRSGSPLILDNMVVVPAGGKEGQRASLMAFDKDTGALRWKGGTRHASYSSPASAVLAGVPQILIVNEDTVSGHDPSNGNVLWEFDWPGVSSENANVSQAVPLPPDRVFVSKGYGGGATLVQLLPSKGDGPLAIHKIWHHPLRMKTKFTNVAISDGLVYGLSDGVLECVDLETGQRRWRDGRYGHGQILRCGDLLLVLSEAGELSLVEATSNEANKVLGSFQALEGKTWNNLALYGPYLLIRNGQQAACYELPLSAR